MRLRLWGEAKPRPPSSTRRFAVFARESFATRHPWVGVDSSYNQESSQLALNVPVFLELRLIISNARSIGIAARDTLRSRRLNLETTPDTLKTQLWSCGDR